MAAGPGNTPASPGCNCGAAVQASSPVVTETSSGPLGLGLRDRLRHLLGLAPTTPTTPMVSGKVIVQPATSVEPPVITQTSHVVYHQGTMVQGAVVTPMTQGAMVPPQPRMQVAPKYQDKVGHETDYSWITGHLFYVHADGGKWVLRYTAISEVDRYGGSVVLTPTVEMRNFREGDLVNVFGEVLNGGQMARPLGGPLYRVNSIQLVERADPPS
jgi:hypothetical protein